jgi:hypothetical protein
VIVSNAKPHRRLTLTQPTTGTEEVHPDFVEHARLEDRVTELEARCDALERLVENLSRTLAERPAPPEGSGGGNENLDRVEVPVVSTGGGLETQTLDLDPTPVSPADVQLRQGRSGLDNFNRSGRKAVAVYAEGLQGPIAVYDDGGGCVYSTPNA